MNEIQEALLEVMKGVHELCVRENITYYMDCGTMLGAIRHKGFIPWDDDMDIVVPRKDFDRLMSMDSSKLPAWMEIVPPGKGPVNMGYAKIANKNTTVVEELKGRRVGGVFVDVFPLDGIADTFEESVCKFKKMKSIAFMMRARQGLSTTDSFARKAVAALSKLFPTEFIYRRYLSTATKEDFDSTKYVVNSTGCGIPQGIAERRIYGTPKLYEFEGNMFYGPECPDEFITNIYGDYMTPPPEDERTPQHGIIYINLNKPYQEYLKENE